MMYSKAPNRWKLERQSENLTSFSAFDIGVYQLLVFKYLSDLVTSSEERYAAESPIFNPSLHVKISLHLETHLAHTSIIAFCPRILLMLIGYKLPRFYSRVLPISCGPCPLMTISISGDWVFVSPRLATIVD